MTHRDRGRPERAEPARSADRFSLSSLGAFASLPSGKARTFASRNFAKLDPDETPDRAYRAASRHAPEQWSLGRPVRRRTIGLPQRHRSVSDSFRADPVLGVDVRGIITSAISWPRPGRVVRPSRRQSARPGPNPSARSPRPQPLLEPVLPQSPLDALLARAEDALTAEVAAGGVRRARRGDRDAQQVAFG